MSRYVLTFPDPLSDYARHHVTERLAEYVAAMESGKPVVIDCGGMLYDLDSPFPGHALMAALERNERDRELSPHWSWGDGRMMNRAEFEAMCKRDAELGYTSRDRDFYGEPKR